MSCGEEKPKCCPPDNAKRCPPAPPCCTNVPETPTFKCPADDCPKPKKYCEEKKEDKCTCVGSKSDCEGGGKQKKC